MKIIIIGGVAAGMSAAAKARREDPKATITVYEKGAYLSYAACGLPYFISGIAEDQQELIIRTKEQFAKSNIDCHLKHEVIEVQVPEKQVVVKNTNTGETFTDSYDKLLIATGASPIIPPFEGVQLKNIMPLKTLENGIDMKPIISQASIKHITIVGGGYIGIEVAENLVHLGKSVRIIELADRILTPFEKEISDKAYDALIEAGVDLRLNEKVVRFNDHNSDGIVDEVVTDQGSYDTDFVVMSIGIKPNTAFLPDASFKKFGNGALIVDQQMRTSVKDIYAAGDCATVHHFQKKTPAYFPLGTTANKCGKLAGINLVGGKETFVGAIGSAAIKVLDIELARTGLSESDAREMGYDVATKIITTKNRPHYYKGNTDIIFKLIYDKGTKEILGAQGVGKNDVVLRINMFAVGLFNHMTAPEFGMIDLCYAPPFSGAWDAVHIAANVLK